MKPLSFHLLGSVLTGVALAMVCVVNSHAALLVYEGFNGYGEGELHGKSVSANSIGLTDVWDSSGQPGRHLLSDTGLTFQGLATSGGSLALGGNTSLSGVQFGSSVELAAGGTLYSSYLVKQNITATNNSSISTRIHDTSAKEAGGYFNSLADTREDPKPSVGYNTTFNPNNASAGSSAIASGETYIVISSFTQVGNTTPGNASLYVLNQSQYLNLLSVGLESLGSRAAGTGDDQVWALATQSGVTFNGTFNNTDYLQILSLSSSGFIDEIRYGTTLADVLPVPEPSMALLGGLGSAIFAFRRRGGIAKL